MAESNITREALWAALPDLTLDIAVAGLDGAVSLCRDALGIPHVEAVSASDAFFGQGFAAAQDRLWQMDLDRHKAHGRSAELLGPAALDADVLVRRLGLAASAQADYASVSPGAKAMLDAYAAGVNTFLGKTRSLPIEYRLLDLTPEPWLPWHCLSVFKIRHVFMGTFEAKLWRARVLAKAGPEVTALLFPSSKPGGLVIIPPGAEFEGEDEDIDALHTSANAGGRQVGADSGESEGGSNSWALAGSRTASGKPLLAGDPHRAPDTPNVYYQNHISCPEFDVIGLSFAGLPGFHHFGHNRSVAWCVTHTAADYQDLYVERFAERSDDGPLRYEFRGEWLDATTSRETVRVRGARDVDIDVVSTRHGPIVAGDPNAGEAIALRYTATEAGRPWANAILDMMLAGDADQFEEAMRPWVDPANNMLCADVHGNISYQMRGMLPIRSRGNGWVPVPGWTGEHEWRGFVPFEEAPRTRNPERGFIVTANNRVIGSSYPHYISMDFAPDYRARRIAAQLDGLSGATVEAMATLHADTTSILAQRLAPLLAGAGVSGDAAASLIERLRGWDCRMDRDRVEPTIYAAVLSALERRVTRALLGAELTEDAMTGAGRGGFTHLRSLRGFLADLIERDDRSLLSGGASWRGLLADAIGDAASWLRETLGDDPAGWQWGVLHRSAHAHPLSASMPEHAALLDPPSVPVGGDADTPQQGAYAPARPFALISTSVARYVYDLADWGNSRWVVPLGSSGHPGSPHYADQMERWANVELYPMLYDWGAIRAQAETTQRLLPA